MARAIKGVETTDAIDANRERGEEERKGRQ